MYTIVLIFTHQICTIYYMKKIKLPPLSADNCNAASVGADNSEAISGTPSQKIKNLYRVKKNGIEYWCVGFRDPKTKKVSRRFFRLKSDALFYRKNILDSRKFEISDFAQYPASVLEDIREALGLLPSGKTLVESVKSAWQYESAMSVETLADDFIAMKTAKHAAGNLCDVEFGQVCGRIRNFKKTFPSFADATPRKLLEWIRGKGAPKTIAHWRGTVGEFYKYCIMRGAFSANPLDRIHPDEYAPIGGEQANIERKIEFLSVGDTRTFMEFIEKERPLYARFYALGLFAGIRVAEIPRLRDEYFRYEDRKITFPAQIGKVKKAWTLENLPENLWEWLEKYKNAKIIRPSGDERAMLSKNVVRLPYNFARRSFSTYHLSLYYDPARTARITRNSPQILVNRYFGSLVEKSVAQKYFEIAPQ